MSTSWPGVAWMFAWMLLMSNQATRPDRSSRGLSQGSDVQHRPSADMDKAQLAGR
jgi:hypothetical protein